MNHNLFIHSTVDKNLGFSMLLLGFPGGASGKEPACQLRRYRDVDSIPGSGKSPEGGYGNPLQYSCLENPMDRGAWQATGRRESDTMKPVSAHARMLSWMLLLQTLLHVSKSMIFKFLFYF